MDSHQNHHLYEAQRRDSFQHWPFADTEKCSVGKMAEAGFYWCGTSAEPDSAACFMCGKVLDNWECDDDPWQEHRKHAPQCMFASLGRPQAQLTGSEFIGVVEKMAANALERYKLCEDKQVQQNAQEARDAIMKFFRQK